MYLALDWNDIQIKKIDPKKVDDQYYMKLTHLPSNLSVDERGPSPYQLKMGLYERLTKLVWADMEKGDE